MFFAHKLKENIVSLSLIQVKLYIYMQRKEALLTEAVIKTY